MIESMRARWAVILVVFVVGLISFLPNVMSSLESWPFSKSKIVYGLDIQGGLHLVMGVDVKGVLIERTERTAKSLQTELAEQGVPFQAVAVDPNEQTQLTVTLNSAGDLSKLEKYLSDYYPATLQVLKTEGTVVTLRYYDTKINEYTKQILGQAIEVIRNRIDEFGVSEPSISAQGSDRILVQLPGIQDSARAKELINRTARLDFRPVVGPDQVSPQQLQEWIEGAEKAGNYALGKDELRYGAYVKRLNEDLKGKIPEGARVVFDMAPSATNLEAGKIPYLVKNSDLSGAELEDANVNIGEFNRPEVIFRFSVEGRRKFAEITEANVGKQVAIVLDEVVQSAPVIQEKINSQTARITLGSRDYQTAFNEAQFIATALRAGALPAALEQLEERTVGPTLGQDAIRKGTQAGLVGGILVLIFMLIWYRVFGVVADVALCFNVLLILAVFTALGATLTLPGVAGIALTLGMAVDNNIVIFERIRDELRKGASLKAAIKDGYANALSAIVDSNVTTAAVCVVLMYYGTGPIRGFAVTLIIGTITSMFTAIFVTRTLSETLVARFGLRRVM